MTLSKGFIRKKNSIKPKKLFAGFCLWLLSAYTSYGFLQVFREVIRFLSFYMEPKVLLKFEPLELYINNLFLAAIASALSYIIALRFVVQDIQYQVAKKEKNRIRNLLSISATNYWIFWYWFAKISSLFGLFYLMSTIKYDIDLQAEFPLFMVLLPIVLFYSTWPQFSILLKRKKLKYFLLISAIFISLSTALAFLNILDHQKITKWMTDRSLEHKYDLELPRSQSQQFTDRYSLDVHLYLLKDSTQSEEPLLFFENTYFRSSLTDIQNYLEHEKSKYSRYEKDKIIVNLHIDKSILMKTIEPIIYEIRKAGIQKIRYITARKYSKYPSSYPYFKYTGIMQAYPPYSSKVEKHLDSLEALDLKRKRVKLHGSQFFRNKYVLARKNLELNATKDALLLNGKAFDSLKMERIIYKFIEKQAPDHLITLRYNKDISYGTYISALDIVHSQFDKLQSEFIVNQFHKKTDDRLNFEEQNQLKERYPRTIIDWTPEEKRLNKLIMYRKK